MEMNRTNVWGPVVGVELLEKTICLKIPSLDTCTQKTKNTPNKSSHGEHVVGTGSDGNSCFPKWTLSQIHIYFSYFVFHFRDHTDLLLLKLSRIELQEKGERRRSFY